MWVRKTERYKYNVIDEGKLIYIVHYPYYSMRIDILELATLNNVAAL